MRIIKNYHVFLLVILIAGCASREIPKKIVGPPNLGVVGGFNPEPWQPILAFAPVDPTTTSTLNRIEAHRETGRLLKSLLTGFTLSNETKKLWDSIWESVNTLSVKTLYELGRKNANSFDKWSRFYFRGGRAVEKFILEINSNSANSWLTRSKYARFGQIRGGIFLKPENEDLFLFRFGVEMDMGELRWRGILDSLAQTMQIADLSSSQTLLPLSENLKAAVEKRFPDLKDDSQTLMAQLLRAYPNLLSLAPKFVIYKNLINVHKTSDKTLWTEVNIVLDLNRQYLEYHYPHFSSFINRLRGLFQLSLVLRNAKDNQILRMDIDTKNFRIKMATALSKGKLVPTDNAGKPLFAETIDLYTHFRKIRWEVNGTLKVSGIRLNISDLNFHGRYDQEQDFAAFTFHFYEVPKIKVAGALWGFIPVGVIDFFIPSNVEELAIKFFKTLASNEGMKMKISYAPGATQARLALRAIAQLEDSGFSGFLMRIFYNRFIPATEGKAEWKRIRTSVVKAFATDFDLLARYHNALK